MSINTTHSKTVSAYSVWPLRWDLLMRYRLIEIVAQWEGRLTTNHLVNAFGIGRQQASKDINTYLRQIAPENLEYDRILKGYKPTVTFCPKLTSGNADEYLQMLCRNDDIHHTFTQLDFGCPYTQVLGVPVRSVDPAIVRGLVQAARERKRVELSYVSLQHPESEERIIAPHSLVCTPVRWHVRAYCEKNRDYRDFVLSRFRGVPELMDEFLEDPINDKKWHKTVEVVIRPDSRLNDMQQSVIARDYQMVNNALKISTRAALVSYLLKAFNIDPTKCEAEPKAQQIVLANYDEIKEFMF